jgi:hypothetical protein
MVRLTAMTPLETARSDASKRPVGMTMERRLTRDD